jgi:predicted Holliday junction resolvase-like endonuclease
MAINLAVMFRELSNILGVCPCCGEMFYLSETRPYLAGKRPQSEVDSIRAAERRLERGEEKLDRLESSLREKAAIAGLRTAKRMLKKIDPVFSGSGYDPHDVKVIFDPVTYVVFNGMSVNRLRDIVLLSKPAESAAVERMHKSIEETVRKGNFEFRTLHIDDRGTVAQR